jgi:hypothetical protein
MLWAVNSPANGAGTLRGALVGFWSAALSALAHGVAGGHLPGGGTVAVLVLACAAVGALAGALFAEDRRFQLLLLTGALLSGQAVGHVVLTAAAGPGAHGAPPVSVGMVLMHLLAAVVCAVLISLVEHLYAVCASALCWLRLFFAARSRPARVALSWPTEPPVVPRPVVAPGGTRAPPAYSCR